MRGRRSLTVVVDHDSGRLLSAAPGKDVEPLHRFFDELGEDRAVMITHVSADMADWVARVAVDRVARPTASLRAGRGRRCRRAWCCLAR